MFKMRFNYLCTILSIIVLDIQKLEAEKQLKALFNAIFRKPLLKLKGS